MDIPDNIDYVQACCQINAIKPFGTAAVFFDLCGCFSSCEASRLKRFEKQSAKTCFVLLIFW